MPVPLGAQRRAEMVAKCHGAHLGGWRPFGCNLGVEFLERQFQIYAVALEQHIGIEAVQAERLAELAVRDLVLAVQIDQERFLRHLREVDPGGAKPFLDVLGDFEVDRHRDARLSFSEAL